MEWACRDRVFVCRERPLVMGILNVTPDSFSDGGRNLRPDDAIAAGRRLLADGADILDVGGESTRPGAAAVPEAEEIRRVLPVIEELSRDARAVISIDTQKAGVAREAMRAGARIINDVSALTSDPAIVPLAAETGAGVVLMHMLGTPRTMQANPAYRDAVAEIAEYLAGRIRALASSGLRRECLAVDPGIGFGKTVDHDLELIAGIPELALACGRPVAIGLSRKSFVGKLTGREVQDRLGGSLAGLVYAVLRGAHVLRVHDVRDSVDAIRVATALRTAERRGSKALPPGEGL